MSKIDKQKILDFYQEKKLYVHLASAFLAGLICFLMGYFAKSCKSKEELCPAGEITINSQFDTIKKKDEKCKASTRKQLDAAEESCKQRIAKEIERHNQVNDEITCLEVCLFHPQCVANGECEEL